MGVLGWIIQYDLSDETKVSVLDFIIQYDLPRETKMIIQTLNSKHIRKKKDTEYS